ncbi:hypothetical protein SSPO_001590 [Streptomyces antimycoticus]|uniref:Uncharacterized protein n=1 Tax=Streptomyces antimycoticus TaxID=68175 RepID=A0A499UJP2_9ACTN|nr:hypothetical protein SSPO_001590 [Streptomyces antimycoticus]
MDELRPGIGGPERGQCKFDEFFDVREPCPNAFGELPVRAQEAEEVGYILVRGGLGGQYGQLLRVLLLTGDHQSRPMVGPVSGRVDDLLHERADELPARLVALDEVGCAAHGEGEHHGRLGLVGTGRVDDEVVNRVFWCLLKGHADDRPAVAQLGRAIAEEQMGKVLHGDLALEGDATAPPSRTGSSRWEPERQRRSPGAPPATCAARRCRC